MLNRILLVMSVGMGALACGKAEDRPPPLPPGPGVQDVWHKAHCSCEVPLSPAAQNYLQVNDSSVVFNVDACLDAPNNPAQSAADDLCQVKVKDYVKAEFEDVLLAKLGPILEDPESVICDDGSGSAPLALIDGPVTCTTVPFENQGPDSSEFPAGTTGIKIEPFCKNAYTSPAIECDYGPAGNCDLNLDVGEAFNADTCKCDSVSGCGAAPVRVERPSVGNADDPLPTPLFDPHGPIAELALGRKDGIVDDGELAVSVYAEACVDLGPLGELCESDSDSDSANLSGGFRLYGGPCLGSSCGVVIEGNISAGPLSFSLGFDTPVGFYELGSADVTDFIMFVGSGELSVEVGPDGHGTIPAGAAQYRAFWRQDGAEKQAIGLLDQPLEFDIDWAANTLALAPVSLGLGSGANATLSFSGTFESSVFDNMNGFCPKPTLEDLAATSVLVCGSDSLIPFQEPVLTTGCAETPAEVHGQVVAVNGVPLSPPIDVVDGKADVPRGDLTVHWTATDTLGRTDETEQLVTANSRPAVAATATLDLGDRFKVEEPSGQLGAALNTGAGITKLNTDVKLAELGSLSRATLRDRASVDLLISPIEPERFHETTVGSQLFANPDLVVAPAIPSLAANNNNVFVGPDQTRTLAPGAYGSVTVHPRGRLKLSAGDYAFKDIDLHSTSNLDLNKANGPIRIVVYQTAKLQANYNHSSPSTAAGFILAYVGTQTAIAETQFRGTLVVPNGSLNLRALNNQSHEGEFFAKNLKTEGGATVRHVPGTCVSP